MNTIAAIEATPTVRLSELWVERWAGPSNFRFGQLAADAEFFYSDVSQMFLQSDWPTIGAVNLPGGGPAYPLSALGARIKYEFPKDASLLFAIFNGDPARTLSGRRSRHLQSLWPQFPFARSGLHDRRTAVSVKSRQRRHGLATTLKFGGWGHLGQFADNAFHQQWHAAGQPSRAAGCR